MAVNLIERAQKIMLQPAAEWDKVADEPANVQEISLTYAAPLVGVGQLAVLLGLLLIAHASVQTALLQAVVGAAFNFGIMFALAAIIDGLAPNFGSPKDFGKSFQVAAYSMTPYWVFTILAIVPQLAIIVLLLALYSLVLIFIGLPKVKKPKKDQEAIYAIAAIGAIVLLVIVAYVVLQALISSMQTPAYYYR